MATQSCPARADLSCHVTPTPITHNIQAPLDRAQFRSSRMCYMQCTKCHRHPTDKSQAYIWHLMPCLTLTDAELQLLTAGKVHQLPTFTIYINSIVAAGEIYCSSDNNHQHELNLFFPPWPRVKWKWSWKQKQDTPCPFVCVIFCLFSCCPGQDAPVSVTVTWPNTEH